MAPTQPFDEEPYDAEPTKENAAEEISHNGTFEPSIESTEAIIVSDVTNDERELPAEESTSSEQIEVQVDENQVLGESIENTELANEDIPPAASEADSLDPESSHTTTAPVDTWDPEEGDFGVSSNGGQNFPPEPSISTEPEEFYDPEGGFVDTTHVEDEGELEMENTNVETTVEPEASLEPDTSADFELTPKDTANAFEDDFGTDAAAMEEQIEAPGETAEMDTFIDPEAALASQAPEFDNWGEDLAEATEEQIDPSTEHSENQLQIDSESSIDHATAFNLSTNDTQVSAENSDWNEDAWGNDEAVVEEQMEEPKSTETADIIDPEAATSSAANAFDDWGADAEDSELQAESTQESSPGEETTVLPVNGVQLENIDGDQTSNALEAPIAATTAPFDNQKDFFSSDISDPSMQRPGSPPLFESDGIPIPFDVTFRTQKPKSEWDDGDIFYDTETPREASAADQTPVEELASQYISTEPAEVGYDNGTDESNYCDIDSTSRRLLASLTPLDTSIHSIAEAESEVSSIASAEAIADQRDLFSSHILPTISEEEQFPDSSMTNLDLGAETLHHSETIEEAVEEAEKEENADLSTEDTAVPAIVIEDGWDDVEEDYEAAVLKASEELENQVAQSEDISASEAVDQADTSVLSTSDPIQTTDDSPPLDLPDTSAANDALPHLVVTSASTDDEPLFGDSTSNTDAFDEEFSVQRTGDNAPQNVLVVAPSAADASLFDSDFAVEEPQTIAQVSEIGPADQSTVDVVTTDDAENDELALAEESNQAVDESGGAWSDEFPEMKEATDESETLVAQESTLEVATDEPIFGDDMNHGEEPAVQTSPGLETQATEAEMEDAHIIPEEAPYSEESMPAEESEVIKDIGKPQSSTDLPDISTIDEISESALVVSDPPSDLAQQLEEELPIPHIENANGELDNEEPHVMVEELPHVEEFYVDSLESSAIIPTTEPAPEVASDELDIVFSQLEPSEAEDLFNQYKDSLKEHQNILKQLLADRDEMRLELEEVVLEYGPLSELETRVSAYVADLEELTAQIAANGTGEEEFDMESLELDRLHLEETIQKFNDAISRRLTEQASRREEVQAETSTSALPTTIEAPASVSEISEATSPRVSSSELKALQEKLDERDTRISELSSRIDHSVQMIAKLEAELDRAKEESKAAEEARNSKENVLEGLEVEILQNENVSAETLASLPMDDLVAQMKVLTVAKVKAVVEANEMRNEVEELKRRLKIEISALDSQLAERETENVMLREQLSSSSANGKRSEDPKDDYWDTPRDGSDGLPSSNLVLESGVTDPQLASEIEKLRKSYDTTKAHLSKCEAELEVATARAEQLDQLFKAESQLRHELQQTLRESKRSSALGQRHPSQNSPSSTSPPPNVGHLRNDHHDGVAGNNISDKESAEIAEKARIAAEKMASLEDLLRQRDALVATLEGEIERLSMSIERVEIESAEAAKGSAKEMDRLIGEIEALKSKESAINGQFSHLESQFESQRADLDSRAQRLRQEKGALEEERNELDAQKRQLEQQKRKLETEQSAIESERLDSATSKQESCHHETMLQETIAERDLHIQDLQLELGALASSNAALSEEVAQLKNTLAKLERRYHQVKREAEESAQKVVDLESASSLIPAASVSNGFSSVATGDLEQKIADLELRNAELEQELQNAIQSHLAAESTVSEKSAHLQDLESELKSVQSTLESVKVDMASNLEADVSALHNEKIAHLKRIEELENQISEAEKAYETHDRQLKLQLAKTEAEIDSITRDLDFTRTELQNARDELEKLQEKVAEDAEKLKVVDDLEASNAKMSSELADIKKQLEDKDKLMYEAYAAFESELGYTAQELKEQFQSSMAPQSNNNSQIQLLKDTIAKLESELTEERNMKAAAEGRIEKLRAKFQSSLDAARAEVENQKTEAEQISVELQNELSQQVQRLESELETSTQTLNERNALIADLEQHIAFLEAEVLRLKTLAESRDAQGPMVDEKAEKENAELRSQNETLTTLVSELESSIDGYATRVEELTTRLEESKNSSSELKQLSERLTSLQITNEELELSQKDLLQAVETHKAERDSLEARLTALTSDESSKSEIARLSALLETAQASISDTQAELVDQRAITADLEQEALSLREAATKTELLSTENAALLAEQQSMTTRLNELEELLEQQAVAKSSSVEEAVERANLLETENAALLAEQEPMNSRLVELEQLLEQQNEKVSKETLEEVESRAELLAQKNAELLAEQERLLTLTSELEHKDAIANDMRENAKVLEERLESVTAENAALISEQQTMKLRLEELEMLLKQQSEAKSTQAPVRDVAEDVFAPSVVSAPDSVNKSTTNLSMAFTSDWDDEGEDAWALDDALDEGIVSTSPVEQQAELEYLRSYLKAKTQECESLKRQLAAVSATAPTSVSTSSAPANQHIVIPSFKKSNDELNTSTVLNKTVISDSPIFAPSSATSTLPGPSSSSLPASPYVAPQDRSLNKSTNVASLAPAANLFNDDFDDGWDDLSFEPVSSQAPKAQDSAATTETFGEDMNEVQQSLAPAAIKSELPDSHPDVERLQSELGDLKAKLSVLEAAERQNSSLKSALENRDNELSEMAEECNKLTANIEELQHKISELEAESAGLKDENEKLDQDVQQALENAKSQREEYESKIIELNAKAEAATRATVIEKSASQEKVHAASPSPSAQLLALQAELERSKATINTLQTLLASKPPADTNGSITSPQRPTTNVTFADKIDFDGDDDGWDNWDDSEKMDASKKADKPLEGSSSSSSVQASQRIPVLEREIDSLRHLIEKKDIDLSTLRVQVESLKTELSQLQTQPKSDDSEILAAANLKYEEEVAKLEARHAKDLEALELRHIAASEESELQASESLSQALAKAKIAAKAEVENEAARRLQVVEETHAAQKEILEHDLLSRSNRITALESEIETVRTQLENNISQLETAQSQLKAEKSINSANATRINQLESDNTRLQLVVEELQQSQNERSSKTGEDDEMDGPSSVALKEAFAMQLEEAKEALVIAEATAEAAREKGEEATRKVSALNAELSSLQALLNSRETQLVEVQSKLSTMQRERDQAQLNAEEDVLSAKEESRRLRSQMDRLKADLDRWAQREKEWQKDLEEARDAEAKRAAEVSVYLKRLESLQQQQFITTTADSASDSASLGSSQGIPGSPSTSSLSSNNASIYGNAQLADWVEKTLKSHSSIAEKLTTENAKLSKGLVSGLVDAQTPVERLAAAKQQLQMRVERLEKDVRRMKSELTARTEERDTLRSQVESLTAQKGDLTRKVAASPAARYHSPAAHFSSYATSSTPLTPFSYQAPAPILSPAGTPVHMSSNTAGTMTPTNPRIAPI